MGIIRIIDHQCPTQAIAVLGIVIAVIPIGPLKYQQYDLAGRYQLYVGTTQIPLDW